MKVDAMRLRGQQTVVPHHGACIFEAIGALSVCVLYESKPHPHLECVDTRFNKVAIQGEDPDGQWTRKPLAY